MFLLLTVLFKHESIYMSRTPEIAVEVSGYIIELNVKLVVDPTGLFAGCSLPNIVEMIPFLREIPMTSNDPNHDGY
jgi:hypothetical protein